MIWYFTFCTSISGANKKYLKTIIRIVVLISRLINHSNKHQKRMNSLQEYAQSVITHKLYIPTQSVHIDTVYHVGNNI